MVCFSVPSPNLFPASSNFTNFNAFYYSNKQKKVICLDQRTIALFVAALDSLLLLAPSHGQGQEGGNVRKVKF